ncbi:MAG: hypothetical protein A3G27_07400 [Betaproteobacteria bacterium RIFCSPLOWO2_12_FULL_66_14]|nr:MAG: hypothetical protein A3G27_07400 [Betaproteobacteria bacterium RIFCSPLOWO2_12_FULL_66_14]
MQNRSRCETDAARGVGRRRRLAYDDVMHHDAAWHARISRVLSGALRVWDVTGTVSRDPDDPDGFVVAPGTGPAIRVGHHAPAGWSVTVRDPVPGAAAPLGRHAGLPGLLRDPALSRTAVIVNEFGAVGLDHLLVEASDEEIVLLDGGCLCCTVRGDLVCTAGDLLARRAAGTVAPFERIVIETTGLADPAPILQALMTDPAASGLAGRLHALNPTAHQMTAVHGAIDACRLFGGGLYDPSARGPDVRRWLGAETVVHSRHDDAVTCFCLRRSAPLRAVTLTLVPAGAGRALRRQPAAPQGPGKRAREPWPPSRDSRRAARVPPAGPGSMRGRTATIRRALSSSPLAWTRAGSRTCSTSSTTRWRCWRRWDDGDMCSD